MAGISKTTSAQSSVKPIIGMFTLSIFVSACLLFSVQPLFTKMALPLLGGASNVWNTAMVFFQAMLLGGYIYAHLISRYLSIRAQFVTHFLVLAVGFICLPLSISSSAAPPENGWVTLWLLALFTVSIGAPFFALSANAPLLQRWYSYSGERHADDPYFLYAASNAGSLLALCAYPVIIEPMSTLPVQSRFWTIGYGAFMILAGLIAIMGYVKNWSKGSESFEINPAQKPLPHSMRTYWILLAFIPSSLMLGVTSHITTNIASTPFIWVMPLALYLLTFIITFANRKIISAAFINRLLLPAILLAFVTSYILHLPVLISIAISLLCFFIIALAMHTELVAHKPDVSRLTEFYIWMSVGGVLGGIFNALIAPMVFNNTYEYAAILLLSLVAISKSGLNIGQHVRKIGTYILALILICIVYAVLRNVGLSYYWIVPLIGFIIVAGLYVVQKNKMSALVNLALLGLISFFIPPILGKYSEHTIYQDRSFFGVITVTQKKIDGNIVHVFTHGDTTHNYQLRGPELETLPLAYYSPGNSFNLALEAVRKDNPAMNITLVGLGAGAMACYEKPGENWVYFEIDPKVVDMALNPDLFSYMSKCAPGADIRIGDARLKLKTLKDGSQDYIILDAFSSDSIPAHLITREALALYQQKLKPGGLLFFHTTNRVMDINSVVDGIAKDAGLATRFITVKDFGDAPHKELYARSVGVLVGPNDALEALVGDEPLWQPIKADLSVGTWTDNYSNILGTIIAKAKQKKNKTSTQSAGD